MRFSLLYDKGLEYKYPLSMDQAVEEARQAAEEARQAAGVAWGDAGVGAGVAFLEGGGYADTAVAEYLAEGADGA